LLLFFFQIQTRCRIVLSKKIIKEKIHFRKISAASKVIQKSFESFVAIRKAKRELQRRKAQFAATKIQALFRGQNIRGNPPIVSSEVDEESKMEADSSTLKENEDNTSPDLEALLSKTQPVIPSKKKVKGVGKSQLKSSTLPHSKSMPGSVKPVSSKATSSAVTARQRMLNRPKKTVSSLSPEPVERKELEQEQISNDRPSSILEEPLSQAHSAVEIGIQADFEDIQLSSPLPVHSLRPSSFKGSRPSSSSKILLESKPSTPVRSASSPPSKHDNLLSLNAPSRPSSSSGKSLSRASSRSPSRLHSPHPAPTSRSISVPTTPKPATPKTPIKGERFFTENIEEDTFLDIPAVDIVVASNEEFGGLPIEEENKPVLTTKKPNKGSRGLSKGVSDVDAPAVKIQKLARGKLTRKRNNNDVEKEKEKEKANASSIKSKQKVISVRSDISTAESLTIKKDMSSVESVPDLLPVYDRQASAAPVNVYSPPLVKLESSHIIKDVESPAPKTDVGALREDKISTILMSAESSKGTTGGRLEAPKLSSFLRSLSFVLSL
jgi:hypothetical protein